MCVRELRCLALGMEWTDEPDGGSPTDRACQTLNDAPWSSDATRTEACLPLALLSEKTAPDGWVARYADRTIREILPIVLRAVAEKTNDLDHQRALLEAAERCEREGSENAALAASAATVAAGAASNVCNAGGHAAHAVRAVCAARDANAVTRTSCHCVAASCAAHAAAAGDGDHVLRKAVQILLECHEYK